MTNLTKPIMIMLILIDLALVSKMVFSKTTLSKELMAGEKICGAIQANMSIEDLQHFAASEGGAFTQYTQKFGVASKSFCRCGVQLSHKKVVSNNHQVWCLR
ncbi:MAG: hypothetical protein JKY88_14095 [Pseudomonadales bacterium]|nr:hypothetical protein [Pseudomonadales bacterium]